VAAQSSSSRNAAASTEQQQAQMSEAKRQFEQRKRKRGKHKKEGGLARLVRVVLLKRLDKTCQMSHWGLRPLREPQLVYGALDSLCEVWIYDVLTSLKHKFKSQHVEAEVPRASKAATGN
jgi:hypothetical protein